MALMSEAYYSQTSYNYALNNPVAVFDINGKWSVSNHHKMTMRALSTFGIGGKQAYIITYYASVYADNPGNKVLFLNNFVHKIILYVISKMWIIVELGILKR